MSNITFIVGGASSGKSRFALTLAKKKGVKVIYVGTAAWSDDEMKRKINDHRKERPAQWKTIEAANTPFQIQWPKKIIPCMLVDGLTLWVSTLLFRGSGFHAVREKSFLFLKQAREKVKRMIMVSDEVGCGIVPDDPLSRNFREILGRVNQDVAKAAKKVYWMAAGLPIQIKGKKRGAYE